MFVDSPFGTLVTIGSDHTDREVEGYQIAVSKQVCSKPVCRQAWLFSDVVHHWDRLEMRSWLIDRDGKRGEYQRDSVSELQHPRDLWQWLAPDQLNPQVPAGSAMFGGTLSRLHDMKIAAILTDDAFELELYDPVLERSLHHRYAVRTLPVVA